MLKRLTGRGLKSPIGLLLPIIVGALLLQTLFGSSLRTPPATEMTYTGFKTALRAGQIETATVGVDQINGTLALAQTDDATKAAAPIRYHTVRVDDPDLLRDLEANHVNAAGQPADNGGVLGVLGGMLPFVLVGIFGYVLLRGMRGASGGAGGTGGPGGIFSFGKSKARLIQGEQTGVTFQSVGGAGEAVDELREITEYLKNPARFQRLGGRMTKGVILVGSPGTGKTLLAKATAGEAGAPFFSVSASEFVEMFVGVGASRCVTCSSRPRRPGPALSSLTSSMPSAAGGPARAQWALMRSGSRPSTNCWPRWMVSSRSTA